MPGIKRYTGGMAMTRRSLTPAERAYLEALGRDAARARNGALFIGALWAVLPLYAGMAGRRTGDPLALAGSLLILALLVGAITWLWRPRQSLTRKRGWRWGLADWRVSQALRDDLAANRLDVEDREVLARHEGPLGRRLKLAGHGWVRVGATTYMQATPGRKLEAAALTPAAGVLVALGERPERLPLAESAVDAPPADEPRRPDNVIPFERPRHDR